MAASLTMSEGIISQVDPHKHRFALMADAPIAQGVPFMT
jgi:hypothetical protein